MGYFDNTEIGRVNKEAEIKRIKQISIIELIHEIMIVIHKELHKSKRKFLKFGFLTLLLIVTPVFILWRPEWFLPLGIIIPILLALFSLRGVS